MHVREIGGPDGPVAVERSSLHCRRAQGWCSTTPNHNKKGVGGQNPTRAEQSSVPSPPPCCTSGGVLGIRHAQTRAIESEAAKRIGPARRPPHVVVAPGECRCPVKIQMTIRWASLAQAHWQRKPFQGTGVDTARKIGWWPHVGGPARLGSSGVPPRYATPPEWCLVV